MKTRFILNPTSGRNRRRPWLARAIRDFIAARRLDADFAITEGPGHATELAHAAVVAGCEVVVAVGGDGTMNEVAQALVGTPAALSLVPCGSGNGLALHLGLPRTTNDALQLAADVGRASATRIISLDTGTVNGRPFFNAMGLGLDADVSHRFNRLTRRGLPAYVKTALRALRELRTEKCMITTPTFSEQMEITLIAVANSDQYGNNARIAPGAQVNDGVLDLVAIGRVGLVGAATIAARLFLGNLDQSPHVRHLRGERFTITRMDGGLIHTDGETHEMGATLDVAVLPRSLRIVVPTGSRVRQTAAPIPELALESP